MHPYDAMMLLRSRVNESVIGQEHVVDRFLIGIVADGHILVEGLPGLAKTSIVKSIARHIDARYTRIQFTPDLTPTDVIGEERLYIEENKRVWKFRKGPIFGNIILADEINRAPAKVQSAMLEAMEEKHVTVAGRTLSLPAFFNVMATQNPIEQQGTYPLSEAQKDRFLMHVKIDYVTMDAEYEMLKRAQKAHEPRQIDPLKLPQEVIFAAQKEVDSIEVEEALGRYMVELVFATRYPMRYSKQLGVLIEVGVSPRGTIALQKCAQAHAWLHRRKKVTIEDIFAVVYDIFRHRLVISEHAQLNGRSEDDVTHLVLEQVPMPKGIDETQREALLSRSRR